LVSAITVAQLLASQRVPQSEASCALKVVDDWLPIGIRRRRQVLAACRVILSADARKDRHGTGGGSLYAVVGGTEADETVVARPRDMVPGDDTVQSASRKVVALVRIGDRAAKLGLRLIPRNLSGLTMNDIPWISRREFSHSLYGSK
jgi:hypothetical protein